VHQGDEFVGPIRLEAEKDDAGERLLLFEAGAPDAPVHLSRETSLRSEHATSGRAAPGTIPPVLRLRQLTALAA
jgi:hypothetical protein